MDQTGKNVVEATLAYLKSQARYVDAMRKRPNTPVIRDAMHTMQNAKKEMTETIESVVTGSCALCLQNRPSVLVDGEWWHQVGAPNDYEPCRASDEFRESVTWGVPDV